MKGILRRLEERKSGQAWLTSVLYGSPSERFDRNHAHLRHVPFEVEGVLESYKSLLRSRGREVFTKVLVVSDLYLRLVDIEVIDALDELAEMVPSNRLLTVLNNSVAVRLTEPGFIDAVKELAEMVPSNRLQTVLNNSVAVRLTEPGFIPFLKSWFDLAGTPVFQGNRMYIRRLWLRRENEGVHRDCYSKEGMRGLKRVLVK